MVQYICSCGFHGGLIILTSSVCQNPCELFLFLRCGAVLRYFAKSSVFCKKLGVLHESKEFVCEIMEVAYKKDIFLHGSRAFE